ncbi:MAG: hypothetical protein ACI814_004801 [Mariniblastus sp.]|jgi:hypothetical protein
MAGSLSLAGSIFCKRHPHVGTTPGRQSLERGHESAHDHGKHFHFPDLHGWNLWDEFRQPAGTNVPLGYPLLWFVMGSTAIFFWRKGWLDGK